MLVVNQEFFGYKGEQVFITNQDKLFTYFSNGQKWLTCEITLKLKNEANTKAIQILNRLELERLRAK